MEIVSLSSLPDHFRHAVLGIGNFDGVHKGHQALLAAIKAEASRCNAPAGVLTFEPHPRRLFRPDDPPFRITPPDLKLRRLAEAGLDFTCVHPFDWDFASQSAEAFMQSVLRDGLDPSMIVIGADFRFGQLRRGTPETLRDAGFAVTVLDPVADALDNVFSSSRIREDLTRGDMEAANRMLGWDWQIEGVVQRGDRRGHQLGYPTANVPLNDTLHPAYGIYAARVRIGDDPRWLPAAANIGIRPMFELKTGQVEAHILDFNRDIYGQALSIRPVKKLRGEAKFDSLDALIAQIGEDCRQARNVLKR